MTTDLAALSAAAEKAWAEYDAAPIGEGNLRKMMDARIAYNHALQTLHRTGNLVQIDREGMRESEQAFLKKVWEAIKGDHNDLRRERIILHAYRAAIAAILGGEHDN